MPMHRPSGTAACYHSVTARKVLRVGNPTGGAAGALQIHQTLCRRHRQPG